MLINEVKCLNNFKPLQFVKVINMKRNKFSNSLLSGDTKVLIEYEDNLHYLPIKEIVYKPCMKIQTHKGYKQFQGIKFHGLKDNFIEVQLNDGSYIKGAREHKVLLLSGDWSRLDLLLTNTKLEGNKRVTNIIESNVPEEAYGIIGVHETECYLSNGIISHNCSVDEDE